MTEYEPMGTIEPPPRVLSDVQRFAVSKWAGHVCAVVRQRLSDLRANRTYEDAKERVEREIERFDDLNFNAGESVHFITRPDRRRGVEVGFDGDSFWYQYTEEGASRGRRYEGYRRDDIQTKIGGKLRDAKEALCGEVSHDPIECRDAKVVELTRIQREASKYAEEPRRYRSEARTSVPLILDDWRYVESLDDDARRIKHQIERHIEQLIEARDSIEERFECLDAGESKVLDLRPAEARGLGVVTNNALHYLVAYSKDENGELTVQVANGEGGVELVGSVVEKVRSVAGEAIERCREVLRGDPTEPQWGLIESDLTELDIRLSFDQHEKRDGRWCASHQELQIDAPEVPRTVEEFKRALGVLCRVIRHEAQHAAQYVLKELKGLDENAGLPSNEVRHTGGPSAHALRDVEFQTRLADEISLFSSFVRRFPRELRRSALRVWTAENEPGYTAAKANQWFDLSEGQQVRPREFFWVLKCSARDKWKEALRTFVPEVKKRVEIP